MTNKTALQEFAEKYCNETTYMGKSNVKLILVSNKDGLLSDLTALISEDYYPKEFLLWISEKELRYSSLRKKYYSDTDRGTREFTLDELYNYWEENVDDHA